MRVIIESADTPNQRKAADLLQSLGLAEVVVNRAQQHRGHEKADGHAVLAMSDEERMVRRVVDIFARIATRNGCRVARHARGHEGSYLFSVNAAGVERAMAELLRSHRSMITDYLSGRSDSEAMTVVCPLVGYIIRSRTMNSGDLQMKDIDFALKPFYGDSTAVNYLSRKARSWATDVLLGTLEGLLKRYRGG